MLQYFGNILPLLDSLSCDIQDKVNIMGYNAAEFRDVIQWREWGGGGRRILGEIT